MATSQELSSLLKDINTNGEHVTNSPNDEESRKALLESARKLVASLESPFEVLGRMNWFEPTRWAMTRIGLDLNLFETMMGDESSPKTSDKLAELTSCDPALMSRILKHLNSANFVTETGPNKYKPNAITAALATRIPAGMTVNCYYFTNIMSTLPNFLRETHYTNPTNKDASPFTHAFQTPLHYFEYMTQPGNEQMLSSFKAHMEFKTLGKKWFQCLDVAKLLDHPSTPDAVLLVDVGGNVGHDLLDFHAAFPSLSGNLVLQDLPAIIDDVDTSVFPSDSNITAQAYDFFTPQPVLHAKAYFLHMILHDWPDESCRRILENLKPALRRGYSKILLNEVVVPDQGAGWFATSVDVIMMLSHAAQERTEGAWRTLVESVGLRVERIWDCEGEAEKVIEVVLA